VNFLLDTNVVSEWTKPRPNSGVIKWLSECDEDRVFLSVVTVAELRHGIELLAAGQRRARLDTWLREELLQRFDGRILPIETEIADLCGKVVARREKLGRPIHAMDALIAATASAHDLTLITRNASDFETSVNSILNPWS
jgi:toxin FitB